MKIIVFFFHYYYLPKTHKPSFTSHFQNFLFISPYLTNLHFLCSLIHSAEAICNVDVKIKANITPVAEYEVEINHIFGDLMYFFPLLVKMLIVSN